MTFNPTAFRSFCQGPFGDRTDWRGNLASSAGQNSAPVSLAKNAAASWRGQIGRPFYRHLGTRNNFAITGISRDRNGTALGSCTMKLFAAASDIKVDQTTSDASGNFTFSNPGSGQFYIVMYKTGGGDVAGTTVNTLVPSAV